MDVLIIAHFITEFIKDGTSRFVYLAEQLSETHSVEIVTSRFDHISKKQRVTQEFDLKTKITLLDEPTYRKNVCIQRFISHSYFGYQVKKYLESRKKPDVIYCAVPSLDCAYYAAIYAQKNKIKFIIDVQDLWPEAFKMIVNIPILSDVIFGPMMYRANYIYSCADVIVGVSNTYCSRASRSNKKNAECVPVFLGTKLESFDQYAEKNKAVREKNKFVIGYCGTLGHSYDIKCVIDALDLLRDEDYTNIEFWVMGDGPLENKFKEYAQEKKVDVVFWGRVSYPKMCGLLASCDVCVNPIVSSSIASIINKHGDYAAAGIPVINTQISDEYRRLLEVYQCGINCEPSSVRDMANAIIYLKDIDKRVFLGENARRLAQEKFDRTFTYKNIIDVICE